MPFQVVNPMAEMQTGVDRARANRLAQIQEADIVRARQQEQLLNQLYQQAYNPQTGQIDANKLYGGMAAQGMGTNIPKIQAAEAEVAGKRATAAKTLTEAEKLFWNNSRDELAAIDASKPDAQAAYIPWATKMIQRAPWTAQLLPDTLTPETQKTLLRTADMILPKGEVRQIGGATATIDPYTGEQIGKAIADVPLSENVYKQKLGTAAAGAAQTKIQAYTPASETLQVEAVKELRDTYKQLKTAPIDIANLRKAADLAATEGRKYMGTGGQAFLSAAKFLKNRLNVDIDPKAITSAEEARSALFQNVLGNLRKLDAQPSQEQQRIMQEALGSLDTDPDALPRVVQIYEDVIRGRVEQHNREVAQVKEKKITMPYDLEIKLPEPRTAPSAAPESKKAGASSPVVVKTPKDLADLPSGSLYIGPDNITRRKK